MFQPINFVHYSVVYKRCCNSKHSVSTDPVDENQEENMEENEEDTFLEETFLDSEYTIRVDVHEKFKR